MSTYRPSRAAARKSRETVKALLPLLSNVPNKQAARSRQARKAAVTRYAKRGTENISPQQPNTVRKKKALYKTRSDRERELLSVVKTPFLSVRSPQKFKTPVGGMRPRVIAEATQKKWRVDIAMLKDYMSQCLRKSITGLTLADIQEVLSMDFDAGNWLGGRRPTFRSPGTSSNHTSPVMFVLKHKGKDVEVYKSMITAFLAGIGYSQWNYTRAMHGLVVASDRVFNEVVGRRLNEVILPVWKIIQRLVLIACAGVYADKGVWNGRGPVPLMVIYDCRWQKAMGWNSLSATGFGVELLTRLPVSVMPMHRSQPTEEKTLCENKEYHSRANVDSSAKGCDAIAAGKILADLTLKGIDVTHLIKDGDASSLPEANRQKSAILADMPNRHEYTPTTESLLCTRHHGKNCAKRLVKAWKKEWDIPKSKLGNYVRGRVSKIVKSTAGDGESIYRKVKSIAMHIAGDHSECPPDHGCVTNDPDYKQMIKTEREDVAKVLEDIIEDHYDRDKCEQLRFNVTTNVVESMNGELISMHPKRLYSCDGKKYDNYSYLIAMRRILGRDADLLLLECIGIHITEDMKMVINKIVTESLANRQRELNRKDRRKDIRKNRAGWDKAKTSRDETEGRTYKSKKRKRGTQNNKSDGNPPKKGSGKKRTSNETKTHDDAAESTPVDYRRNLDDVIEEHSGEEDEHSDADWDSDGYTNGELGPAMSDADIAKWLRMQQAQMTKARRAQRAAERA